MVAVCATAMSSRTARRAPIRRGIVSQYTCQWLATSPRTAADRVVQPALSIVSDRSYGEAVACACRPRVGDVLLVYHIACPALLVLHFNGLVQHHAAAIRFRPRVARRASSRIRDTRQSEVCKGLVGGPTFVSWIGYQSRRFVIVHHTRNTQ